MMESQGCRASEWDHVMVATSFEASRVAHVNFEGNVCLGGYTPEASPACGLRHVTLRDVTIGDDCRIEYVRELTGYHIGARVCIRGCGRIVSTGKSAFGNGTLVYVLNEAGGRNVTIYDRLTAQEAYILAYRKYKKAISTALEYHILNYALSLKGTAATIGDDVTIDGVRLIEDVRMGDGVQVLGALRLKEGSVLGGGLHPTVVGDGVVAEKFIVCEGSAVTDGAMLTSCFVGEACHIGRGFSAVHSLFFANCHMEHGEACALMAGPFSVSHHRSTLLIAAQTSFFNAGSGSNQSNHSYKLGPNKFGILERGAKLASGSYLYWPARIGAFSVVLGRHKVHADLRDMPFSYIVEEPDGSTSLLPGVALRSVGVARDVAKWPKRDERLRNGEAAAGVVESNRDFLSCSMMNPYVAAQMLRGLAVLQQMAEEEQTQWQGCHISKKSVQRGIELYEKALDEYLLRMLLDRIEAGKTLQSTTSGIGVWCDYLGCIAPQEEMEKEWLSHTKAEHIWADSNEETPLNPIFRPLIASLPEWEWNYVASVIEQRYGATPSTATQEQLVEWANLWQQAHDDLLDAQLADAKKEFDDTAQMLYGVDATEEETATDFYIAMGNYEENSFVSDLLQQK